jgi:hypothetical protein
MSRDFNQRTEADRVPDTTDTRQVRTETTTASAPSPLRVTEVDRLDREAGYAEREPAYVERQQTRVEHTPGQVYRPDWTTEREASALLAARDSVRWGPIVAGLVTALTTFLLLSLLAVGIGITAADPASGTADAQAIGIGGAITGAVIGLFSFFLGGLVAARTSAAVGRPAGALNGFLVWALGVIVILALGALGLSSILGAAGSIIGQTGVPSVDAPNLDPAAAADTLRNSALGAFISLAIPALAATLGGIVGVASKVEDRTAA